MQPAPHREASADPARASSSVPEPDEAANVPAAPALRVAAGPGGGGDGPARSDADDPGRDDTGHDRAGDAPHIRPPRRMLRWLYAYWVTSLVIVSYLSVRFQARFRSRAAIARLLTRKHLRNARRIERAILHLQGLFIKVGQLISIMTNFLPAAFREQLEGLQDQVPPRPYPDIERRIREELGSDPDELFARFERRPVASASIGQVHIARLHGGDKVAVKVQYPDIEQIVKSDLVTLRRIFSIVGYFVRYEGLDEVYREIRAMILEELDFRGEAQNASRIADNFARRRDVAFPRPIPELSTARILTTYFEEGVKVSDLDGLADAGVDRKALARQVVELYCQQIFTDGLYHADPHPGNLLVRRDPDSPGGVRVVFLDFGAVAAISPEMRKGIAELIQGGLSGETQRIVRAMKQMGFISRGADDRVFDRVVEYFHSRFQEEVSLESFNLRDIKFDPEKSLENLADLRRMDISLRELTSSFHVPKEWILLERTLLLLVGLCTALDPAMNPMTVIRPYLERFVLGDEGDWSNFVVDTGKDLLLSVVALPSDIRRFMRGVQGGELTIRVPHLDASSRLVYRAGNQVVVAAIGIAGAAIAIILEGRGEVARAEWAWWVARGAGALLVWSWWSTRGLLRRER
ncbi:ABC1 kinase family protein [Haliangium sp.]|uniref:ABC1 kinase family protein n=1 Tax=Haliangium sp. TaxID=2663208 RepID=UPI003D14A1C8